MTYDFAIIGAGIAGASVAAELAPHGRTVLLEAEDLPGYHSTGRSAAFWAETYGGTDLQPLTTASHDFLANPPKEFAGNGFLERRGKLHVANAANEALLDSFMAEFENSGVVLKKLDRSALLERLPGTLPEWTGAVSEPSCADIDVGGLHQAYLRAAKRRGAELRCNSRVESLEHRNGKWLALAGDDRIEARIVVNAAGAWVGEIGKMAGARSIAFAPLRRTVLQLRTEPRAPDDLPLVIDANGQFYFKGEAGGRLWLSPHDETLDVPRDVAPEEFDIALAIDRFEHVVDWKIQAVERKWAGLRTFSPDRLPVYGFDPVAPGFFWCAGQGGSGIQTSPAYACLCRELILEQSGDLMIAGVNPATYSPGRFG